ncbi:phenylalanine racemase [Robertmurraya kyonggiensis]|uniref:Phenylalanine racemase n=2 Tax=Robertmurraya kyonggiensis TaxID=1037680 RepID=A0A4U1D292_9BACI|nr:phenylalanine racemase [Robertmurraya kyonggiensis]
MSRSDFDLLTETEKMFIRKEHENKFISDTTWMRNAVLNAEANINRKKNKRFIELFPKTHKADKEFNENAIQTILEMEEKNGKSWVDRVYKANGMKTPQKGGK